MSYKKFVKDIGLLGITQLITALSGIITLPIITKFLGTENYGTWVQLLVTLGLISSFAIINLPSAIVRFLAAEKNIEEIQDGIWSVFVLMIFILTIISVLLLSFLNPVSQFLKCNQVFVLLLIPIIIFECLNSIFYNFFRAFQEIKKCSYFTIFFKLTETLLIILTIILGYGLIGAILSMLVARFGLFLIMFILIIKKIGIKIPKFLKIKEYLSFCLPLIPVDASYWIIQSSDKYFIAYFLGMLFVGYYAPAYTLGSCISFLVAPLGFLLPAVLSKYHDENEIEKVKIYIQYSLKYFLIIAIPAVFGLSIMSKQLLTTFSTLEIAEHSYFIVPIVAISIMLVGISGIITQSLLIKKKTKTSGAIWIISALLNFILNFIFVPKFGILGAAITTFLAYGSVTIITWYYAFREITFKVDWKIILKYFIASIIMAIIISWLNPIGALKEIFAIILGVAIYCIMLLLLKSFNTQEINLFKNLFRK